MFWFAIIVIVLLLALAIFLNYGDTIFDMYDSQLIYLAAAALILVLGAGVFLTHAVPSLANDVFAKPGAVKQNNGSTIIQDVPIGFVLQEE